MVVRADSFSGHSPWSLPQSCGELTVRCAGLTLCDHCWQCWAGGEEPHISAADGVHHDLLHTPQN